MVGWRLGWRVVTMALALAGAGLAWMPADVGQAADRAAPTVRQAWGERWIDVRLSEPTRVTAFEGDTPVYRASAVKGTRGWETPIGTYYIQRRVANERMVGPGWDVSDVLFTQYFTEVSHALHYNWWSSDFGYAGSKGCLGMSYADSLFFWEWASIGTPIEIHW